MSDNPASALRPAPLNQGRASTPVVFIGGPLKHARADLTRTPPYVVIQGARYERLDDPDTGECLGGYVFQPHA